MKKAETLLLISKNSEALIENADKQQGIVLSKDIFNDYTKALKSRENNQGLIIFLSADEFLNIKKDSSINHKNIAFIILDSKVKDKKQFINYANIIDYRTSKITQDELSFLVPKTENLFDAINYESNEYLKNEMLLDIKNDQEALVAIGQALSIEKDPDKLLRSMLYFSKKITGADAGSIFIVENKDDEKVLRFKYSDTFSRELKYEEFTMPINKKSIAGFVAETGQVINIEDVYNLSSESPFGFNKSFDQTYGYRTKSMLVVPMKNHLDEIIGVIQLINSKEHLGGENSGNEAYEIKLIDLADFENMVVPFDIRYEALLEAIAGQAAIALENNRMLKQIEYQFEEFVKASIGAIESRDPATSGHSTRVAKMAVKMGHLINDDNKKFKDRTFSDVELKELEFSALLHDFGKVYIDPAIFMKGKKLFEKDYNNLLLRLQLIHKSMENGFDHGKVKTGENDRNRVLKEIKYIIDSVQKLNEPFVTDGNPEDEVEKLKSFADDFDIKDYFGNKLPVLTESEIENLSIKRGSLNNREREEIKSHVVRTYDFVKRIPWPDEYKNIPEIALRHHESPSGAGYPDGVKDIPIQARIISIADIYDALSASDRPYKKALSQDKVISILKEEAEKNNIDPDIAELFIEKKGWLIS